jgi:hypothetical protein
MGMHQESQVLFGSSWWHRKRRHGPHRSTICGSGRGRRRIKSELWMWRMKSQRKSRLEESLRNGRDGDGGGKSGSCGNEKSQGLAMTGS